MKVLIVMVTSLLMLLFPTVSLASGTDTSGIYQSQYRTSGADSLRDALPKSVGDSLSGFDISDAETEWNDVLTPKNIFSQIKDFFASGLKKPLAAGCSVAAILLFGAATGGLEKKNETLGYAVSAGITVSAILPVIPSVAACVSAIKASSVFMTALVPVYAGILGARGKLLTAAGFSTVVLFSANAASWIASYAVVPLTGMQLATGICGSASGSINISSAGKTIKKISTWLITLVSTVLLGILGLQTVINSPADNLASKTAKFIVGTAVPVVGTAVSEAVGTVRGCLKLLGSSVGIYALIAVALIFLPVVAELVLWRAALLICASMADIAAMEQASLLLRNIDSAVSFILGVMILMFVLFTLSVTIVAVV